ncbi:lipocalin family protein [Pontiella sp.]|uniref:lipocalin family protein n=1 Tax=Pontiella sp. TaxID=2837462 RepID=UPI0035648710
MMRGLILGAALLLLSGCRSTRKLEAVSGFSPERYMGVWYEAVRYPHRFEKGMSSVSAAYTLNDDGTINVLNRGFVDAAAEWKEIEGVAKPKGADNIGWLKVSFFKPFYASYKIVYLNEDYTRVIVAGPTYSYLWIMSRSPGLPAGELETLIGLAEGMGYERGKMIIVDQSENLE